MLASSETATAVEQVEKITYWEGIISEWEKSDKTQPEFCGSKQINLARFIYWRKKLLAKTREESRPQFVPVHLKAPDVLTSPRETIELSIPIGIRLRIPVSINVAQLRALLPVFGVSPC